MKIKLKMNKWIKTLPPVNTRFLARTPSNNSGDIGFEYGLYIHINKDGKDIITDNMAELYKIPRPEFTPETEFMIVDVINKKEEVK
jgi:hypothetical protein